MKTFSLIPDNSEVIIDASRTRSIHWDVLEIIEDFKVHAPTVGISLKLVGFNDIKSRNTASEFHSAIGTVGDKIEFDSVDPSDNEEKEEVEEKQD